MRSTGELIMALVESGLNDAQKALVLELAALATASHGDPSKAAKSARNARYYQSKKLNKTPETRLNQTTEKGLNKSPNGLNQPPLACVVDNLLEVIPLEAAAVVVVAETSAWPGEQAKDWSAALVDTVASPRLNPAREPGLTISLGELVRWRTAGASWEFDVIPVVTTLARKQGPPIKSWKFFSEAVAQSVADNRKALEIPEARHERPNTPSARRSAREDNLERGFRVGLAAAGP